MSKPNVELVCKVGRKLNVDLVLYFNLESNIGSVEETPLYIEAYLINVKTKKHYYKKYNLGGNLGEGVDTEAKIITEKVFNDFTKDKSLQ